MTEPAASANRPSLPLDGCRILDLTRALAGPYCTMILADLGADVVKVEPANGGDMSRSWGPFAGGVSAYFLSTNRNKRSIAVDLRQPEGLHLVHKMAAQCNVFVENFKPGVAEQMGLDYKKLASESPHLVYASISGFGPVGPYETWPGLDQIAQGMSGLMSITGFPNGDPLRAGIPIADLAAGMWAAIGVLGSVLQQRATGIGQRVDTSLLGSLVGMLCIQGQRYLSLGEIPTPMGNDHPVLAPYGTFETANGLLNIAVITDGMWRSFCQLLEIDIVDHPDYRDNQVRVTNRTALKQLLEMPLRRRSKEEWTALCIGAGIPAGPINRIDEALDDPHVRASGWIETVAHPNLGMLRQLGSPIHFSTATGPSSRTAPPLLGEHSLEVLRRFRFDEGSIGELMSSGIVVDAKTANAY